MEVIGEAEAGESPAAKQTEMTKANSERPSKAGPHL